MWNTEWLGAWFNLTSVAEIIKDVIVLNLDIRGNIGFEKIVIKVRILVELAFEKIDIFICFFHSVFWCKRSQYLDRFDFFNRIQKYFIAL